MKFLSFLFSVRKESGTSSIVCLTAAAVRVGEVPVTIVIDNFNVTTTKTFSYKKDPVITAVHPNCSFQRLGSRSQSACVQMRWTLKPPAVAYTHHNTLHIYVVTQRLQAGDRRSES